MIKVTRLNNTTLWVNPHLIESAEETPDLVITLITGKKIVIKENIEEIKKKIIEYRKSLGFFNNEI
ncbi:MAG TPA: flagellar FlbD family protein [bacterium]|nr:flagellar FlbD family protein [bacterium]HOL46969.1 flagellar FlbD family protein [bacterium]HPQ18234.1 flagellar FlbD family protein [bacterium]